MIYKCVGRSIVIVVDLDEISEITLNCVDLDDDKLGRIFK